MRLKGDNHFAGLGTALAMALTAGSALLPSAASIAAPARGQASPVRVSSAGGAVVLSVGQSRVIDLPATMSDVVVANPAVADVVVRSNRQFTIIGKASGETNVFATAANGKILYSGTIRVGTNLSSVDQMLHMAMPEANIQVSTMNGMVLLTGTINAPEDAAEAERLTQAFVGKDVTVVSRLRTATPLQVNLQVRIAEVSRSLLHQVGSNISGLGGGTGSFSGYIGRSDRPFVTQGTTPTGGTTVTFNQPSDGRTTLGFLARLFGMNVTGALDLAETTGLATSLAQPNLTALSGETASFLAGGEYPYSVSNGLQGNTIEFKQYGVQLSFTPTVLSDGRISLRVRPSVSSLDFSINSAVPALRTRTAETTVELGSGQAFMLAGLLSNDTANNISKVPGIGNVPILGSLAKSRNFQRNETELVMVVTPYLVKPVNASDIALPTDGFRNADEAQGFLLQQNSDGISGEKGKHPEYVPPAGLSAAPVSNGKRRSKGSQPAPGFSF